MIDPTRDDIGRRVVFRPFPGAVCEEGTITDMSLTTYARARQFLAGSPRDYVFVRYGNDTHSEATRLAHLEWVSP